MDKVEKVAENLEAKYGHEDWFRGIGVMYTKELGFYVSLRVAPNTSLPLPHLQDGVWVLIEERELAKPMDMPSDEVKRD